MGDLHKLDLPPGSSRRFARSPCKLASLTIESKSENDKSDAVEKQMKSKVNNLSRIFWIEVLEYAAPIDGADSTPNIINVLNAFTRCSALTVVVIVHRANLTVPRATTAVNLGRHKWTSTRGRL